MKGREKCEILRQIRQQVARENGIPLAIAECTHQGECRGTCPRCEAEVHTLEEALRARRRTRGRIALAGISAGMVLALSGCTPVRQPQDPVSPFADPPEPPAPDPLVDELTGAVELPDPGLPDDICVLDGEIAPMDYVGFEDETAGMVPPDDAASPLPEGM